MTSSDEGSTHRSSSDSIRTTTTAVYEQEPFETYQLKVKQLLQSLFPPCQAVQVHRIKGGSWNRITGATLSDGTRYIIRNPRVEGTESDIPDQVATLRYIQRNTPIPVPTVFHFDVSYDNILRYPYVVQNWVGGRTLREVMYETDVSSRMAIAKAVVHLMVKMYSTSYFNAAGAIRAENPLSAESVVLGLPGCGSGAIIPPRPITDSLTFFTACFDMYRKDAFQRTDKAAACYSKLAKRAVIAIHAERPFSNRFCIMHPDFEPRNILVHQTEDGEYVVDALLDYDGAVVAPVEAVWSLPHWLWTWDLEDSDSDEPDDALQYAEPGMPETKEVKAYVENELDRQIPGFMEIWRRGEVLRKLLDYAVNGLSMWERAEKVLGPLPEWWYDEVDEASETTAEEPRGLGAVRIQGIAT